MKITQWPLAEDVWPPRIAPELQQILKAAEAFEAQRPTQWHSLDFSEQRLDKIRKD